MLSKKEMEIIEYCHVHDGSVVGATRETIYVKFASERQNGLNVGGQIGIAR